MSLKMEQETTPEKVPREGSCSQNGDLLMQQKTLHFCTQFLLKFEIHRNC